MSGVDRRGRPITLSYLEQELERLLREFNEGRHTGKNEKKVMDRMQKIRDQIAAGNYAEESLREGEPKLGAVVPVIQYYEKQLERLSREFNEGRHTGKNERKVMDRMQKIRDQILQVDEKGEDWPEEAVWVSCPTSVQGFFDWDDGADNVQCPKCAGTGLTLMVRKKN